jgi:hypothetical protein
MDACAAGRVLILGSLPMNLPWIAYGEKPEEREAYYEISETGEDRLYGQ